MTTPRRFSPEVRERAVRLVRDHQAEYATQWAAITSIASKIGCAAETLRLWVRRAERDTGQRPGLTSDEQQRLKLLERENRELRRANEILRKAPAYFAQAELDRRGTEASTASTALDIAAAILLRAYSTTTSQEGPTASTAELQ